MIICICNNLSENGVKKNLTCGKKLVEIIKEHQIKQGCKKCVPYLIDLEKTFKKPI